MSIHRQLAAGVLCVGLGLGIGVGCVAESSPDSFDFDEVDFLDPLTYKGDIGTVLGTTVASGNTTGMTNGFTPNCPSSTAPDASYTWTAPATASYTFTTVGSTFDTILHLRPYNNSGQILACNDDANGTLQSSVTLNLTAGQTLFVVVDGYNSNTGNYKLNITTPCPGGCNNPPSNCYNPTGTCSNGTCAYSLKPSGTSCDDGIACTTADHCDFEGYCTGTSTCKAGFICTVGGSCEPNSPNCGPNFEVCGADCCVPGTNCNVCI